MNSLRHSAFFRLYKIAQVCFVTCLIVFFSQRAYWKSEAGVRSAIPLGGGETKDDTDNVAPDFTTKLSESSAYLIDGRHRVPILVTSMGGVEPLFWQISSRKQVLKFYTKQLVNMVLLAGGNSSISINCEFGRG